MKAWWVILIFLIGWGLAFWSGTCRRSSLPLPGTVTVEVPVVHPPVSHVIDSLEGAIVQVRRTATQAQKQSAAWKSRADRLSKLAQDLQGDVAEFESAVAVLDTAVLDQKKIQDDRINQVVPDTLHVEYDIGLDRWYDIRFVASMRIDTVFVTVPVPVPPPVVRYEVPWGYYVGGGAAVMVVAVAAYKIGEAVGSK